MTNYTPELLEEAIRKIVELKTIVISAHDYLTAAELRDIEKKLISYREEPIGFVKISKADIIGKEFNLSLGQDAVIRIVVKAVSDYEVAYLHIIPSIVYTKDTSFKTMPISRFEQLTETKII
jgi:hypothetical protein